MSHNTMRFDRPRDAHGAARRISWIAIGMAAASLLAIDAQAQDSQWPQTAVSYADLNLAVPADADRLYARLQKAANRVCGQFKAMDLRARQQQRKCYRESLAQAVATVDHAAITALYRSDRSVKLAEQRSAVMPRS